MILGRPLLATALVAACLCGVSVTAQKPVEKSLAEWVAQLGSDLHGPRQEAYRALLKDRSPRILGLLGAHIESFVPRSQDTACNLLRNFPFGDSREIYKQLLGAKDPYLRVVGAGRLLKEAAKDASRRRSMQVLVTALAECPDGRKMSAVNACRDVLDETVFVTMRRWLQPKQSSHIVTGVLRDLLRRERGASVATSHAVRLLLASKDTRVLAAAHTYLLREDAKHEKQLADLSKKEPAVFWVVRDLLPSDGRYSDAIVAVIVSALLAPRSDRDVNQLAQLLKKHSQAQLGSALRELIGHEKEDIRAAALRQLSTLTGGLRAKDLLKLLRSDAVVARLIAADTMRRRDDPSGLEVVLQAVPTAGKHKVEALRVLGRFRSRKSIPLLLGMLDDTDVQVRNAAWRGVQETMRSLFPYRSFDFRKAGYDPQGDSGGQARPAGIERIRAWWASVK